MILIKIIVLFLLADLVTGVFHFAVDRYGVIDGKHLTKSVNLLLLHHKNPRKIIFQSYWEITGGVYKISGLIFCLSLIWGVSWELLLFLLFSSNGNMIHKWSHQRKSETPYTILCLQKLKLIQDQKHHNKHHTASFDHNYCVMTNYLNPILHRIYFWEFIIKCLKIIKISPNNSFV